jgi:hypothetical protein
VDQQKEVSPSILQKKFPFIQTTARSEATNALFKKGVGAQFSMTSFLREYQRIMDTIHTNEDELDNKVENKKVLPTKFLTKYYIERQAHDYTTLQFSESSNTHSRMLQDFMFESRKKTKFSSCSRQTIVIKRVHA